MIDQNTRSLLLRFQKNEITEHYVYNRLARAVKDENKEVLQHIARDEKSHYEMLKKYTEKDVKPGKITILKYIILAKIFGITFAIKLMEKGEAFAQIAYNKVGGELDVMGVLMADEQKHEKELINLIQEEKLDYMGSVVLGLNDALVELTGTLAGLSFALQNSKLISLAGLITGISASFSMAASEYLSKKHEGEDNAFKASVYTGIAYIFTVLFLVFPFLVLADYHFSLAWSLINAIIIIFIFTYFNSVVKDLKFKKIFWEMFFISMGVAFVSFLVGSALKIWFNIDV